MPNVFHPAMNTVSRVSIFGALLFVGLGVALLWYIVRTPYVTEANVIREQPVPFSHQHHVGDAGIDCRYCHTSVETAASAGVPGAGICMNCHSHLFRDAPMLAPVRTSFRTGQPIAWMRVHDVPDFAKFDHSIHVAKGVGCIECHGRVDEMPLMWREHSLQMQWCLDCHRHAAEHIRPREFVFDMVSAAELAATKPFQDYVQREFPELEAERAGVVEVQRRLLEKYQIENETNCSNCHF
jgi:hypothetical protein